jgi:Flp pilus assembly protein TadD
MVQLRTFRRGALAAALGLGLLAGCQQGQQHRPPPPVIPPEAKPEARLNAHQVADVRIALARSMEQHGELPEAIATYQDALKKDPTRGDAWLRLAIIHDRLGKFREAEEMYHKALAAHPGDPAVYCSLGYSFYLQGRMTEAEMNLRQAIAIQPEQTKAHNNLGLLLARAGRNAEALDEFRKAGCDQATAHTNLAFAQALEHHLPEARRNYQLALALSPASPEARTSLQQLDALQAKLDDARPATADPAVVTADFRELPGAPEVSAPPKWPTPNGRPPGNGPVPTLSPGSGPPDAGVSWSPYGTLPRCPQCRPPQTRRDVAGQDAPEEEAAPH